MNFQLNINLGSWLAQLNNKTIDKIYQVDFNEDRHEDFYLPWLFFITFQEFDKFLQIEGDFDGEHIKIDFDFLSNLDNQLKENDLKNEPYLWSVYPVNEDEKIGKSLLGKRINSIEYGIDKDFYIVAGEKVRGEKDLFTFIKFQTDQGDLTIFEGGTGLYTTDEKDPKLNFEETFDIYRTKKT